MAGRCGAFGWTQRGATPIDLCPSSGRWGMLRCWSLVIYRCCSSAWREKGERDRKRKRKRNEEDTALEGVKRRKAGYFITVCCWNKKCLHVNGHFCLGCILYILKGGQEETHNYTKTLFFLVANLSYNLTECKDFLGTRFWHLWEMWKTGKNEPKNLKWRLLSMKYWQYHIHLNLLHIHVK